MTLLGMLRVINTPTFPGFRLANCQPLLQSGGGSRVLAEI